MMLNGANDAKSEENSTVYSKADVPEKFVG